MLSCQQRRRLLVQFGVNKGMLREVSIRLHILVNRLRQTPDRVEEIDKEIDLLENEMDTIFSSTECLYHIANEEAQLV